MRKNEKAFSKFPKKKFRERSKFEQSNKVKIRLRTNTIKNLTNEIEN